jgi:hypothetical protein
MKPDTPKARKEFEEELHSSGVASSVRRFRHKVMRIQALKPGDPLMRFSLQGCPEMRLNPLKIRTTTPLDS